MKSKFVHRNKKNGMIRDISTILSGSFVAQIIMLASLPILTRLYDSEAFGKYQIYVSSLNVLLMVAAFRYEMAIITVKRGKQLESLLKLISRIIIIVSLVLVLVMAIGQKIIRSHFPELSSLVYILPLAILIGGFYHTFIYLPIRNKDYRLSARSKILQSISYVSAGFAFAFSPVAALGLVIADMSARAISGWNILRGSPGVLSIMTSKISSKTMKNTILRFRQYPLITFPGTLLSASAAALVPFALLGLFGLSVAGQYSLVERFILAPVGMIGAAVAQVFTGKLAAKYRGKELSINQTYRSTIIWLAVVALLPSVIGFLVVPILVPIIFGSEWELSGQLSAAAIPIAFMSFVAGPVSMALVICNRQKVQLLWEISRFVLTASLFVYIYKAKITDPVIVITWYAYSVVFVYSLYLVLADYITRKADNIYAEL